MAKAGKSAEMESAMDYAEHDRTFHGFLWLTRWVIACVVSLLVAMAAGFFGGMGLVGGTLILIILMIISSFIV
jgi:Bacterial aa3 type cytochrome c oxidase subunit IV